MLLENLFEGGDVCFSDLNDCTEFFGEEGWENAG